MERLTESASTSLFMGKICSMRTKGRRGDRISLSSSMSRSRLFTPRLFTLWAVPLSKLGSVGKIIHFIRLFFKVMTPTTFNFCYSQGEKPLRGFITVKLSLYTLILKSQHPYFTEKHLSQIYLSDASFLKPQGKPVISATSKDFLVPKRKGGFLGWKTY